MPHMTESVLVIDGDEAVRRAVRFALEAEGYAVRTAATADEALRKSRSAPRCLICDQDLPDGEGLALLARLRRHGVHSGAVLMVSNAPAAVRQQARALQVPVVEKPLLTDELFGLVRSLMRVPA